MITAYDLRCEQKRKQRYSGDETFEDMDYDEWLKKIRMHYPELCWWSEFVLEAWEIKSLK